MIAARCLFALSVGGLSGTHQLLTLIAANAIWTIATPAQAQLPASEPRLLSHQDCGGAGVDVSPMKRPFADSLGFADSYGAIFDRPEPGGPAANAGIEAEDVLTAINGAPLETSSAFDVIIAMQAPVANAGRGGWKSEHHPAGFYRASSWVTGPTRII